MLRQIGERTLEPEDGSGGRVGDSPGGKSSADPCQIGRASRPEGVEGCGVEHPQGSASVLYADCSVGQWEVEIIVFEITRDGGVIPIPRTQPDPGAARRTSARASRVGTWGGPHRTEVAAGRGREQVEMVVVEPGSSAPPRPSSTRYAAAPDPFVE